MSSQNAKNVKRFDWIYETIWRQRAEAAGWDARFTYDGTRCTVRLTRRIQM